jgi:hypothetical protein
MGEPEVTLPASTGSPTLAIKFPFTLNTHIKEEHFFNLNKYLNG